MSPLKEKGVLTWCDDKGEEFEDTKALEKAKRCGKAFIRVEHFNLLPTPYELTGDKRWDAGGDLYRKFDLGIEEELLEDFTSATEKEEATYTHKETLRLSDMTKGQNPDNGDQGVKVLRQNDDIQNENAKAGIGTDPIDTENNTDDLAEEFMEILSPEINQNNRGERNDEIPVTLPNDLMAV
jgi:hypothetical protein